MGAPRLLATLLVLAQAGALAHEAHRPVKPTAPAARPAATPEKKPAGAVEDRARAYFTDTELVDQHGQRHRFYSDLLRGKRVLINFAFTSCTTACSPVTANLARVQKQLGERVGKDVLMLTVSVDPENDTPQALRHFAEKFKAQPGWLFLTGAPNRVHALQRKLGAYTEKPEEHSTVLLIGDVTSGNWVKTVAMDRPERIVDAVLHLNDALPQ